MGFIKLCIAQKAVENRGNKFSVLYKEKFKIRQNVSEKHP